jgi:hypothetical protein
VVHLLQLVNLHQRIIIIQSPQFTLGFTLSIMNSMGLDSVYTSLIKRHIKYLQCPKIPLCPTHFYLVHILSDVYGHWYFSIIKYWTLLNLQRLHLENENKAGN